MQAAVRLSSSTCARFLALVLGSPPRFASMSSRNSAPLGSAVSPVYNALGGPQGKGHVTFDRTQSQYLDAGPRTLNIATNGGLTIVAVVRFTGTAREWERIVDLGSCGCSDCGCCAYNNVVVARKGWGVTQQLTLQFVNGESWILSSEGSSAIVQNTWLTVVASYRASTREYWLTVNGVTISAGIVSQALPDRTLSYTWIGRSHCDNDYFNGDMAGVFVVDEYLSADATSAIADAMARGEDLTTQGPCAPQVLSPLLPVILSSADLCPIFIVSLLPL
jgi:hypothetical protein